MFEQRHTQTLLGAAFTSISLIYHMTVYKIRKTDRNPIVGLITKITTAMVMVVVFYMMFYVLGVRGSPIRGNFIVYIMTGIFMFMTHNASLGAVMGAENNISAMMKHTPMNTATTITSAALATLYSQFLAILVVLLLTHAFIEPLGIEVMSACMGWFLMAWLSGCAIGMVFRAAQPWWPKGIGVISMLYMRANMFTSGKMVVANTLPAVMLSMFDWNPLFHIIDQTRGAAFINYSPHNSSITYPIMFTLVAAMIGLMGEFVTRNSMSLSWQAGR